MANQDSRSIGVVDLMHFRMRKQIALDAAPAAILAHSGRGKVFVLAPEAGTVYEIDAASLAITRRMRAGNQAAAMQMSSANDALWVLYRDPPTLVELPLDSFRPNRRIPLSAQAGSFHVSRDNQAAVISSQDDSIILASLSRGIIDRTFAAGSVPSLVQYRSDGKHLLVGSRSDRSVTIFDVPTGKVVVRLPLPLEPKHFCFDSFGGQLFVSGDGVDAVVIIFPFSTEVDQTILAGHAPDAMAAKAKSPQTPEYLFVANPSSNTVTVLDVDTRKLVGVVKVGREPRFILLTPDSEYALVLNRESGDLAVIRTLSLSVTPDGSLRRYKSAPLFTLIPVGENPVSAAIIGFG